MFECQKRIKDTLEELKSDNGLSEACRQKKLNCCKEFLREEIDKTTLKEPKKDFLRECLDGSDFESKMLLIAESVDMSKNIYPEKFNETGSTLTTQRFNKLAGLPQK